MQVYLNDFLFSVSRALDSVEHEFFGVTANHSKRVAYLSMRLCMEAGCSTAEVLDMASCATLHDSALTEYALHMGRQRAENLENLAFHCKTGERNASAFPFMGDTKNIVLHHHENWDGSGFFGIGHKDLPLRACALRIADDVDRILALGNSDGTTEAVLRQHLLASRENLYHPLLVDAFLGILDDELLQNMADTRIDAALAATVPACSHIVTPAAMVKACRVFEVIIDARSHFTLQHTKGITQKISIMEQYYKLEPERADLLLIAACLHDIGKLTIPLDILEKNGPLNDEEFAIMRGHALASHTILDAVRGMEKVALWAPSHHEKLDGTGYPHGKKGDELCFESRLLACIDIYQALSEDRPYRAAMNHASAIAILYEMVDQGKLDAGITKAIDKVFAN